MIRAINGIEGGEILFSCIDCVFAKKGICQRFEETLIHPLEVIAVLKYDDNFDYFIRRYCPGFDLKRRARNLIMKARRGKWASIRFGSD